MKKIFVDLDGVLSDFNKRYKELFGVTPAEARILKHSYRDYWVEFILKNSFAELDLHEGAEELIQYLRSLKAGVHVLTSSGGFDYHGPVQQQKMNWLAKHGILWAPIVVPGRSYKAAFADSNSILIDDTFSNIEDFIAKGGQAIHHTDVTTTIAFVDDWMKSCT